MLSSVHLVLVKIDMKQYLHYLGGRVVLFKAVIFDWDGTLADTKDIILKSFRKALEDLPLEVDEELIKSLMGKRAKEIFSEVLKKSDISFDEATLDGLVEKRVKAELELSSCVELKDGAMALLDALKPKVKLALASMNNKHVIDSMLNGCGLRRFFDVVISADEVAEPKPDPEIFLKCASKLKLKSDVIVVIEDTTFGVRAAKAADMKCIAVSSGFSDRKQLEKMRPDLIIGSIKEKKQVLRFVLS
jgi:HAD superfamily hydrolase (TIGR01509 family)